MKANELQIGDIVIKRNKEPICIFEIDDYRGVINNEPDGYDSETNINIDEIEPIPLTAEILEKNGFKKTTDEKYYMCDDYSELSAEEYSDSIWLICCADLEYNLPVQKIMVSYVHQFQQFLRLCGEENLANHLTI